MSNVEPNLKQENLKLSEYHHAACRECDLFYFFSILIREIVDFLFSWNLYNKGETYQVM